MFLNECIYISGERSVLSHKVLQVVQPEKFPKIIHELFIASNVLSVMNSCTYVTIKQQLRQKP